KLWYLHVLPSLNSELQTPEVLAAALQPLLYMIEESTTEEYTQLILPVFRAVFAMPKSVQATVTLLENMDIIMKKTPKSDLKSEVLPMLYNAFDSTTPQIQCAALHAVAQTADFLEETAVRKMVLPRTKQVFENNNGIKVQANALTCIEKIIDKLEKTDILDEVLPMLSKAKIQDPAILMPVVRIYKFMLGDKRYGLTVNLLATKVMPSLIPVVVSPALKLDQFTALVELLRDMLEHVARSQRNKLKLEKLSIPSTEILPVQYSMEQATGYPHRPPLLRLQSRRTSVSMDDVVRRSSSASSSPDSNLLTVQGNLPGRRHSDNTIQPPRILVAPASPDGNLKRGSSAGMLPIRRHSGGQDNRFNSWTPKVTPNFNIEFFTPTRPGMRRYSAAAVCATDLQRTAGQVPGGAPNQASSILQQIGSGVQQLFSGK
ncbi:SCY1-like protein 2, partial [Stegodyphus dumicola]|uniref:SCY1-like protein 2 n=1 Tax=Stegodyphus dumicola TaxID=202533 RepID=UPI0015AD9018